MKYLIHNFPLLTSRKKVSYDKDICRSYSTLNPNQSIFLSFWTLRSSSGHSDIRCVEDQRSPPSPRAGERYEPGHGALPFPDQPEAEHRADQRTRLDNRGARRRERYAVSDDDDDAAAKDDDDEEEDCADDDDDGGGEDDVNEDNNDVDNYRW